MRDWRFTMSGSLIGFLICGAFGWTMLFTAKGYAQRSVIASGTVLSEDTEKPGGPRMVTVEVTAPAEYAGVYSARSNAGRKFPFADSWRGDKVRLYLLPNGNGRGKHDVEFIGWRGVWGRVWIFGLGGLLFLAVFVENVISWFKRTFRPPPAA